MSAVTIRVIGPHNHRHSEGLYSLFWRRPMVSLNSAACSGLSFYPDYPVIPQKFCFAFNCLRSSVTIANDRNLLVSLCDRQIPIASLVLKHAPAADRLINPFVMRPPIQTASGVGDNTIVQINCVFPIQLSVADNDTGLELIAAAYSFYRWLERSQMWPTCVGCWTYKKYRLGLRMLFNRFWYTVSSWNVSSNVTEFLTPCNSYV